MGNLGKEVAGLGKPRVDGWGVGTRMGLESDTIPLSIDRSHAQYQGSIRPRGERTLTKNKPPTWPWPPLCSSVYSGIWSAFSLPLSQMQFPTGWPRALALEG